MTKTEPATPIEYAAWRMKGEYRRSCSYVVIGLLLIVTLGFVVAPDPFGAKIVSCWNAQFFPPVWKVVALVCLSLCAIQPAVVTIALAVYIHKAASRRLQKAREALERQTFQSEIQTLAR